MDEWVSEWIKYVILFQAVMDAMNKSESGKEKESEQTGFQFSYHGQRKALWGSDTWAEIWMGWSSAPGGYLKSEKSSKGNSRQSLSKECAWQKARWPLWLEDHEWGESMEINQRNEIM